MKRRGFLREKLEGLSHYVRTWVPFYQERSSGGADFADLPIIDKRLLKARYKDFISAERAGLADYIADFAMNSASFPAGGSIERPGAHGLFFERTSGTSGIPFVSVKTSQERALMAIAQMKMRRAIDPGFEADKLYAFNHVGQRVLENSPVNYAPANLAQLYVNVAKKGATWLHCPPRVLVNHQKSLGAIGSLCRSLRFIECNGHYLSETAVKSILSLHPGVEIVDMYGVIETWGIAWRVYPGAFVLNDRSVHMELVDEGGSPIEEDGRIGRVVITSLILKAFPIVRFATGDYAYYESVAAFGHHGNQNGGGRRFRLIEGRDINRIKGDPKNRFGNIVFENILSHVFHKSRHPELKFVQVWQTSEREFLIKTSELENSHHFLHWFAEIGREVLRPDAIFRHQTLSCEQIEKLASEKPMLFVCKYQD